MTGVARTSISSRSERRRRRGEEGGAGPSDGAPSPLPGELQAALEIAPSGIVIVSRRRIAFANAEACRILGAAGPEELVGRNAAQFLHSESWKLWDAATSSPKEPVPVVLRRLDGNVVAAAIRGRPLTWGGRNAVIVDLDDAPTAEAINRRLTRRLVELENLISNVPGLIYQRRIRPDGQQTLPIAAGRFFEALGVTNEELRADPAIFLNAIHPEDRDAVRHRVDSAVAALQPLEHEFRLLGRDGEVRWAHVSARPRRDAGGVVLWDSVLRDVTRLKQQEQDNALLRRALMACDDGLIITERQAGGTKVIFVNPAFERITGYSFEDAMGRDPQFLMGDPVNESRIAALRLATIEGRSSSALLRSYRKNGELFWSELHLAPILDENGKPSNFVGTIRDATERVEAAERLRVSIDTMPDGFALFDAGGRLVLFNAAYRDETRSSVSDLVEVGITAGELMRTGIERGRFGDLADSEQEWMIDRAVKIATVPGDRTVESWDKKWRQVRTRKLPNGDTLSIHTDITGVKSAELLQKQLRRTQRMELLGTLAGGTAHEFNNMLVPIKTLAELAQMEIDRANPVHEFLGLIVKSADRAADLVRKILDYSRSEDSVERIPVDLGRVVRETITLLFRTIPTTVKIVEDIGVAPAVALADPAQIEQVLMNLASNAVYAIGGKTGKVWIALHEATIDDDQTADRLGLPHGRYLCLSVQDTGEGIDADTLRRVFDPFFTTKPVGEGTGLGLAVSHAILQAHNGALSAESRLGEGSTFRLYLPRHDAECSPVDVPDANPSAAPEQAAIEPAKRSAG